MNIGVKVNELLKEAFPDGSSMEELEVVKKVIVESVDSFIVENAYFE